MFISPRVYTWAASLTPGIWSEIPRRSCAYISLLSVYNYMCALLRVKWCLGADRRNPHRHGGAFIKGSMASVAPRSPLWVAQQAWPIYLYQGQGGGSGRRGRTGVGEGGEERLHGQVLLHMPGGMAGASHRGILLKVRQADLPVTSAWGRYWARKPCVCVCVCEESLWVYM